MKKKHKKKAKSLDDIKWHKASSKIYSRGHRISSYCHNLPEKLEFNMQGNCSFAFGIPNCQKGHF
jgi:hypothetical protein